MVITMAKLHIAHASRLGQKRPKVGNNNGQLRIATPPQVAHASRLGQKKKKRDRKLIITMASYATSGGACKQLGQNEIRNPT